MRNWSLPTGLGLALAAAGLPSASAGITNTTGDAIFLDPPPASLVLNALVNDDQGFVFNERQNVTIPAGLYVDITAPGVYDETSDLDRVRLQAGTIVNSYFVHVDNDRNKPGSAKVLLSVTFDQPIIGIMVRDSVLDVSDAVLGAPGTVYPTGQRARTYEFKPDRLSLSSDLRTVTIRTVSKNDMDEIRIVTQAPEPTSLALLALGALGGLIRRR